MKINFQKHEGGGGVSQEDSDPKPKVARHELPWVNVVQDFLWDCRRNRVELGDCSLNRPSVRSHTPFFKKYSRGFSLLEVMIAIAILFMGTFAILDLISSSLANARRLQRPLVDASALVSQLSLTNKLIEGVYSGNLGDMLGKAYSEYKWTGEVTEVRSNKLFQVDFVIQNNSGSREIISRTTTLFFRPESPAGSLDGGIGFSR